MSVCIAQNPGALAIDIWYGSTQSFGQNGTPVEDIHILGHVSDSRDVDEFYYTINGGPQIPAALGLITDNPNLPIPSPRLAIRGNFNLEIPVPPNPSSPLVTGVNTIVITALFDNGSVETENVQINFTSNSTWILPTTVDWQAGGSLTNLAQVVDGLWELTPNGVHPVINGYDRMIAIGDRTWTDYEVTVPITMHAILSDDTRRGIGVLLRWQQHTDDPTAGHQPKTGWNPHGALGWWSIPKSGNLNDVDLEFWNYASRTGASKPVTFSMNTTYMLKARVTTGALGKGVYEMKVWENGQAEPVDWDIRLEKNAGDTDLPAGSLVLVTWFVDATFGDVTVTPVSTPPVDSDGDTIPDNMDNCPDTPNLDQADTDVDGAGDVCDACPNTVAGTPVDATGCPTAPAPADFDGDGDVDMNDFGKLQICMTGPNLGPPDPGCEAADLDFDNDVDPDDFAIFSSCISGPNVPADPSCTN